MKTTQILNKAVWWIVCHTAFVCLCGFNLSWAETADTIPVPQAHTKTVPEAPAKQEAVSLQYPDRHIVINIPSRTLTLYDGIQVLAQYPVGVGRPGFPTPVGSFSVLRKVLNPAWENPYKPDGAQRIAAGSGNPLGTRWIGFHRDGKGEYGMHGTPNPKSVGQYSSHGCVRMHHTDVEALFEQVEVNTPVEVTYDTTMIKRVDNQIVAVRYADTYKRYAKSGTQKADAIKTKIQRYFPNAVIDDTKLNAFLKPATKQQSALVGHVVPAPAIKPQLPLQPEPVQTVQQPENNNPDKSDDSIDIYMNLYSEQTQHAASTLSQPAKGKLQQGNITQASQEQPFHDEPLLSEPKQKQRPDLHLTDSSEVLNTQHKESRGKEVKAP